MRLNFIFLCLCLLFLQACQTTTPPKSTASQSKVSFKNISWQEIPGWKADRQDEAWPALIHNCKALGNDTTWQPICKAAKAIEQPSKNEARAFFENWFTPQRIYGPAEKTDGLLTGYYIPLLKGSWQQTESFRFPVYATPDDIWRIKIGDHAMRGRLGDKVVLPYYTRAEIENDSALLSGKELLWVNSAIDLFFLHVQGSGQIKMPNGQTVLVSFAEHNGHDYTSIGKVLIEREEIDKENVSLFSIKRWLEENPTKAASVMQENARYIFFRLDQNPDKIHHVVGSMNVPLTPQRSVAIDPKVLPRGSALWIDSNLPGQPEKKYQRLVFAQDTGAAIKNALRADLYWGKGSHAEQMAGIMQESLGMILLKPKTTQQNAQ